MHVIAICGLKGGVGKTSTAVNLATLAATSNRTALWDLDPQGGATWCLGLDAAEPGAARRTARTRRGMHRLVEPTGVEQLSVVRADLSLRRIETTLGDRTGAVRTLRRLLGELSSAEPPIDLVVLDCPAGLGLVAEAAIAVADIIVVPVLPSPMDLRTVDQLRQLAERRNRADAVFGLMSRYDERKLLHREMVAGLGGSIGYVRTAVPESSAVERMAQARRPVVLDAPNSAATRAYRQVWAELSERIGVD